jgi:hypothetical protein
MMGETEPLNSDPEIQRDIDQTIAQMQLVEANYKAEIASIYTKPSTSMQEEQARRDLLSRLRAEWLEARRPFVQCVQDLASSTRKDGVTYLSPITPEMAARINRALSQ